MTGKGWVRHTNPSQRVIHIWPVGDLVEHDADDDGGGCVCVPTSEPIKRDDGSVGWMPVHHSLDGREKSE